MSVSLMSGFQGVQKVGRDLEFSSRSLNHRASSVAKRALKNLSNRRIESPFLIGRSSPLMHEPTFKTKQFEQILLSYGEEGEGISLAIGYFIKKGMTVECVTPILHRIKEVSLEERESICLAASSLIHENLNAKEIACVITSVEKIDKEKRVEVCALAALLIQNNLEASEICLRLDLVEKIPQEARTQVVTDLCHFIRQGMREIDIVSILKGVEGIEKEDKGRIFAYADRFIKQGMKGHEIAAILEAAEGIAKENEESVVVFASYFIKPGMRGGEVGAILEAVGGIPLEDRERAFSYARRFIKKGMKGMEIAAIIESLQGISKKESGVFFRYVKCFVREAMRGDEIASLIKVIKEIGVEEFALICGEVTPLIEEKDGHEMAILLLKTAVLLRCSDLEDFLFEERILEDHLPLLKMVEDLVKKKKVESVFSLASLREIVGQYLTEKITKLAPDRAQVKELRELTSFITENGLLLGISDEDPLMDLAMRIQLQVDPRSARDSNNVYRVHQKILERKKEIIDWDALTLLTIQEQEVRLNCQALFEEIHSQKKITFGELQNSNPDVFRDVFLALEERVENFSILEKEEFKKEIDNLGDLASLKSNCASASSRIYQWMHFTKGKEDDEAPFPVAHLDFIAKVLLEKSDVIEDGEILSEKERMLLGVAASIQNCYAGQDEGIAGVYHWLLAEKQSIEGGIAPNHEYGSSSAKDLLYLYLVPKIQKEVLKMETLLSTENPMMRELISDEDAFNQLAHQSLYLKNLIGEDLHLEHTLILDQHAGFIDKALREKSRGEVLQVFFKHYTLNLLRDLGKAISKDIIPMDQESYSEDVRKKARGLFNAITGICGEGGVDGTRAWSYNGNKLELTEVGMIALLEKMGYLTTV